MTPDGIRRFLTDLFSIGRAPEMELGTDGASGEEPDYDVSGRPPERLWLTFTEKDDAAAASIVLRNMNCFVTVEDDDR